ncbi:hypothetical protein OAP18_02820, partial [Gammaproteobacteria bacterium]|nr:hypothetical protein [Gammaproteobacteria bacterium]
DNTLRLMSCSHGGSHKHKIPLKIGGQGHLIEDSWFYGVGRYVVQCFNGNNMTIRRNVMRWDATIANEPSEPNAAMSNYSCNDMIWENNISLDYGVPETPMSHCGDMCMSTIVDQPNLRVRYLGNMVINHDPATDNNIALRADQKGALPSTDITVTDFYIRAVRTGIAVNPLYQNFIVSKCTTIDVENDGQIGSSGGGLITCGDDADISVRYVEGVKTSEALFPFAHQALIKRDLCESGERQSDWCLTGKNLGDYVLDL